MKQGYLDVTQDAGRKFVQRQIPGEVLMLNLLRFREVADYTKSPELMPAAPISGADAYQRYIDHSLPHLQESGGDVLFCARGGPFLIGPGTERWDMAMLVRHQSRDSFLAFATNTEYLAGAGHRIAALEDSRLLPLTGLNVSNPGSSSQYC